MSEPDLENVGILILVGDQHVIVMRRSLKAAHQLALDQGGVVRRAQLHALGVAPRDLTLQIEAGIWITRGRKVLVLPGVGGSFRVSALVAGHVGWPRACLTGAAALAVNGQLGRVPWDALAAPRKVWLITPTHTTLPARTRVFRRAPPDQSHLHQGVWVAPVRVVMSDLLRFLPFAEARNLAFRASAAPAWRAFMSQMDTWIQDHAGQPGVAQLRKLAGDVALNVQSVAEKVAVELLESAGMSGFHANYRVRIKGRTFFIDIAYVDARLAIEIDGRAFHSDRRWQADLRRQNLLENAGWRVLRFSWEDLKARPEVFISQIAEALEARTGIEWG